MPLCGFAGAFVIKDKSMANIIQNQLVITGTSQDLEKIKSFLRPAFDSGKNMFELIHPMPKELCNIIFNNDIFSLLSKKENLDSIIPGSDFLDLIQKHKEEDPVFHQNRIENLERSMECQSKIWLSKLVRLGSGSLGMFPGCC